MFKTAAANIYCRYSNKDLMVSAVSVVEVLIKRVCLVCPVCVCVTAASMNNLNDSPNIQPDPRGRGAGAGDGNQWNYALLVHMLGLAAFGKLHKNMKDM